MISFKNKLMLKFLNALVLLPVLTSAQSIEIFDISPNQVASKIFYLNDKSDLEIEAVVGEYQSTSDLFSTCWILNKTTHQVAWEFSRRKAKRIRSHQSLSLKEAITLAAGYYQVYYALNPQRNIAHKKIFGIIFESDSRKYYSSEWGIKVQPILRYEKNFHVATEVETDEHVVVQMTDIFDDEYHKKGFELTAPIELRIYALGEGISSGRQMSDFAWISNIKTRQRMWEMEYRKTEHAGGAMKNRKFEGRILLPAGEYMVYYVTDDSHSAEEWNQLPPYDPDSWGITISIDEAKGDLTHVKPIKESDFRKPMVDLTRLRNNENVCQGFQLLTNATLHIFALGEASYSRSDLVDYGWITNANTREMVWRMEYRDTEYAGGAKKNRVFDGFIELSKGKYFVCYRTDDSHAFRSWNESQPWLPESWGITISCEEKDNEKTFRLFDEGEDINILVQLIRVGDDEKVSQKIKLTDPTKVRIYAIGEGRSGKLFDYGWIESEDNEIIWEMTYRESTHAGGGDKNRIVNEVIQLEPGTYNIYFETDDSHSYRNWNTTPPNDEEHWGITVIRLE